MDLVLEFLAPSALFVVFCINPEPLAHCLSALKGRCVNLKMHETWLRRYQVLPGRTRPDMMMSGSGGYLLTGIKLSPEAAISLSPMKVPPSKCSPMTASPIKVTSSTISPKKLEISAASKKFDTVDLEME